MECIGKRPNSFRRWKREGLGNVSKWIDSMSRYYRLEKRTGLQAEKSQQVTELKERGKSRIFLQP